MLSKKSKKHPKYKMNEVTTYLWISIFFISTYSQTVLPDSIISADNKSESNKSNSENNTLENQSIVQVSHQNASIVRLKLTFKEDSVLPYIRDEIFYRSHEYNITVNDLIELSDIREFGFNQTVKALRYLNVSEDIFSVNNFKSLLEFSNMTFMEFYEKLKKSPNISAPALLEAMQALNIDTGNFSLALVYGKQDMVYDVLRKGVYTKENWEIAIKKLGVDIDTLFMNVKNLILDHIETKDLSYYDDKIHQYLPLFGKKMYNDVWTALDINLVDIFLVPKFRDINEKLYSRLNRNTTLGVSTSPHEITIHKKTFDDLEDILKILTINAEVVVTPQVVYQNLVYKSEKSGELTKLWNNNSMTSTIEIWKELEFKNDQNCTYITIIGDEIVENPMRIVNSSHTSVTAESENDAMFNFGNPLICQEKFVGLATSQDGRNLFVFDTFYRSPGKVSTSGSHADKVVPIVFLHMIVLYFLRLIY